MIVSERRAVSQSSFDKFYNTNPGTAKENKFLGIKGGGADV